MDYPAHKSDVAARKGKVVSGNGVGIHTVFVTDAVLANQNAQRGDLNEFADRIEASSYTTTVYSTEALWKLDPDRLTRARAILGERGIRLEVVAYVRDMAGHALSLYGQAVKRHKYIQDFSHFIGREPTGFGFKQDVARSLFAWADILGNDALHVIHYDTHRKDAVAPLVDVLGVPNDTIWVPGSNGEVNRSLTREELNLMRRLNQKVADRGQLVKLSNILMDLPALGSRKARISRADADYLVNTFESDVDRINNTFFPKDRSLQVIGKVEVVDGPVDAAPLAPRAKFLLDWLAAATPQLR
ncbi:hypothetical protein GCM10009755_29140 [Brevibacterium samyangense]|uniref:Uncharacterized protein n=1 Tax=Brevibacterium samyangense TaxID=366888 RepID=A0ABP5F5R0_9MICO